MGKMLLAFFAVILGPLFSLSARADVTPYHFFDLWYNWAQPVSDVRIDVQVLQNPGPTSHYYWSHFFSFAQSNVQGYTGLQTGAQESADPNSAYDAEAVLFAIWGGVGFKGYASAKGNQDCRTFNNPSGGDQGTGVSCFLRQFSFDVNASFEFEVVRLQGTDAEQSLAQTNFTSATVNVWRGQVKDLNSGSTYIIGDIFVPISSGNIAKATLFDEYFSPLTDCTQLPAALVTYSNLTGDNQSMDLSKPSFVTPNKVCPNQIQYNLQPTIITATTSGNLTPVTK